MQLHDRAKDGQDRLDILKGRGKRELMDVVHGGSTLQLLFGMATDRDLESLSNRLLTLGQETTGIVNAIG